MIPCLVRNLVESIMDIMTGGACHHYPNEKTADDGGTCVPISGNVSAGIGKRQDIVVRVCRPRIARNYIGHGKSDGMVPVPLIGNYRHAWIWRRRKRNHYVAVHLTVVVVHGGNTVMATHAETAGAREWVRCHRHSAFGCKGRRGVRGVVHIRNLMGPERQEIGAIGSRVNNGDGMVRRVAIST